MQRSEKTNLDFLCTPAYSASRFTQIQTPPAPVGLRLCRCVFVFVRMRSTETKEQSMSYTSDSVCMVVQMYTKQSSVCECIISVYDICALGYPEKQDGVERNKFLLLLL